MTFRRLIQTETTPVFVLDRRRHESHRRLA